MATKKAAAKKTSTAKKAPSKPAATTKVTTKSKTTATSSPKTVATSATSSTKTSRFDVSLINVVIAELVGTFVLAMVALLTFTDTLPLYVGLTLVLLVMSIGAVSGAHVNPAVTFGLWVARKIKAIQIPFYWGAQFLGAMAAVVVVNLVSGNQSALDFGHFSEFSWVIMGIELVGTAVFLFGLITVVNHKDLSATGKAFGVGLSLAVGLLVAGSLYTPARTQAIASYQKDAASKESAPTIPHQLYVSGATLNPAVALAATETTESELKGSQPAADEKTYSRLSLEVIAGTLVGAAVGAGLARLVGYRFKS